MSNVDYDLNKAGTQTFEINDFVRAGFSGRSVDIAYFFTPGVGQQDVLYRAGRTNVSVQHRADPADEDSPASGYVAQPLTTPTPASTPINGVEAYNDPLDVPTAAQQSATLDDNYVDFTIDANFADDDGSHTKQSPYLYVKTSCSSSTHTATAGALTFRQTAQEDAPWISFSINGFVPN
jgi:hypothetical protein